MMMPDFSWLWKSDIFLLYPTRHIASNLRKIIQYDQVMVFFLSE